MKSGKDFSKRVKGNDRTLHHSVGTAAMAPKSLGGVVNAELKVCGTSNLRVVCDILERPFLSLTIITMIGARKCHPDAPCRSSAPYCLRYCGKGS
ncbi:GMC oxidoreductase domain-containing protein [Rhizoctonia solani AG-1 IA]|uniref:GMC oxidoreductase domain-containing protein n=1 Tax=Thanatephorus cucumeris (strain AG1-IA) TaxID=983506 RepID=L8WLT8_THACA|nr:GMC oxidoreductase domain-containing protein [Rhizoctonia solani AG-1 IA]